MKFGFSKIEFVVVLVMISFLLSCMGFVVPVQFLLYLACGWVLFLRRVIPQITVAWDTVGIGIGCLLLFAIGFHFFLNWLRTSAVRQAGNEHSLPAQVPSVMRNWHVRWTSAGVVIVISMFIAGISMVGASHQLLWLVTSPEPLLDAESLGRTAARRMQSNHNLKQIGIAFHNYHDVAKSFPAGSSTDSYGLVLHGWQTKLLPFVEQIAVYEQIDLTAPWSHTVNRVPFQTKIPGYLIPFNGFSGVNADGYAISHYAGNQFAIGGVRARSITEFTDGAANTLLAGEVSDQFKPWGSPTNWRDPKLGINRDPNGFGSPWNGGAQFVFGDGSTRFLSDTTDPSVLRALSTPADGDEVKIDLD